MASLAAQQNNGKWGAQEAREAGAVLVTGSKLHPFFLLHSPHSSVLYAVIQITLIFKVWALFLHLINKKLLKQAVVSYG